MPKNANVICEGSLTRHQDKLLTETYYWKFLANPNQWTCNKILVSRFIHFSSSVHHISSCIGAAHSKIQSRIAIAPRFLTTWEGLKHIRPRPSTDVSIGCIARCTMVINLPKSIGLIKFLSTYIYFISSLDGFSSFIFYPNSFYQCI